jgi:HK97 family phage portal protein
MTSAQFIGATIANMLLRGVGYWEKEMNGGQVIGLSFLPSSRVSKVTNTNGTIEWHYRTPKGTVRKIPRERLVIIPAFSLDGENGLSTIAYGANMFGNAQAAEQAASGMFARGLLPSVYFKYPTTLKAEQRADARVMISRISGAVNAGEPVIMEAGMESGALGINPEDAQLLESRAFSVEEVCSWFRVQPFMIGRAASGQTNWGTGIEQQMIGFITFTLAPWLRRIEQAIEKDLLTTAEQGKFYAEFSLDGLLRGDSAARQAFYASALQNGWMNRNEVRALQNLGPIEGGDVYTVQSNLVGITAMGADVTPGLGARSALLNWLDLKGSENEIGK